MELTWRSVKKSPQMMHSGAFSELVQQIRWAEIYDCGRYILNSDSGPIAK